MACSVRAVEHKNFIDEAFREHTKLLSTQYGAKIKRSKSDNAPEYTEVWRMKPRSRLGVPFENSSKSAVQRRQNLVSV